MGRRYDESEAREKDAETDDDVLAEDVDDPRTTSDDDLITNPAPPASPEYVDFEIARIQPPA